MDWRPLCVKNAQYAIILLNQPIQIKSELFQEIWNSASFRIAVDGGTNQIYNFNTLNSGKCRIPDLITGDFDSIEPFVKAFYEKEGAKVIETLSQDNTDFTKSLIELFRGISAEDYPKVESVLVLNEPSGRYDQVFANISTLVKFKKNDIPIYIFSRESISWIIVSGTHNIFLDEQYVQQKPYCGLIPLDGPTKMETSGLKWNLSEDMDCSFSENGIVSTSNEINGNVITLKTNKDVLWTMKSFI